MEVKAKSSLIQVRNVATLGGHLGWCHPCSDVIPILMAGNCSVDIMDQTGNIKNVRIDAEFFPKAYRNSIKSGQLVLAVKVRRLPLSSYSSLAYWIKFHRLTKTVFFSILKVCFVDVTI